MTGARVGEARELPTGVLTAAFAGHAVGFFSQFGDVTRVRVSRNPKVR